MSSASCARRATRLSHANHARRVDHAVAPQGVGLGRQQAINLRSRIERFFLRLVQTLQPSSSSGTTHHDLHVLDAGELSELSSRRVRVVRRPSESPAVQ